MNRFLFLFVFLLLCGTLSSQELNGSWKLVERNGSAPQDMEIIKIYQDGYFSIGAKIIEGDRFHSARGGEFTVKGNEYTTVEDFNTENPELIGKEVNWNILYNENQIIITDPVNKLVWQKISNRTDDLTGTWAITGRKRGEEIRTMTPGDRRTVKILSGGRFQWIAFNSATGDFSGTGGGTYTAENGKYKENIEFFSRDDSRVGASLDFEYSLKEGNWHHQGFSSKGDPIYEIWSPYKEAFKN